MKVFGKEKTTTVQRTPQQRGNKLGYSLSSSTEKPQTMGKLQRLEPQFPCITLTVPILWHSQSTLSINSNFLWGIQIMYHHPAVALVFIFMSIHQQWSSKPPNANSEEIFQVDQVGWEMKWAHCPCPGSGEEVTERQVQKTPGRLQRAPPPGRDACEHNVQVPISSPWLTDWSLAVILLAAASRDALALALIRPGATTTILRCLAGSWARTSDLRRRSMTASSRRSFSSPRLEEPE